MSKLVSICAAVILLGVCSAWAAGKTAWQVAEELMARGQYQEAGELYAKLERDYIQYARERQWALYQQGVCKLNGRQANEAFQIWLRLRTLFPQSSLVVKTLLLEADSPDAAARRERLYDEILAKYPNSDEAATALLKRGQSAHEQKDFKSAAKWWKEFVSRFPQRTECAEVKKKLEVVVLAATGNRGATAQLEGGELLRRADVLFDRAAFKEAARLYEGLLQIRAKEMDVAYVAGRLARCQLSLGDEKGAFETLQRTARSVQASAPKLLAELVVQSAMFRHMDDLRMQVTEWLVGHYPSTFEAEQVLFVAGAVEMARGHKTQATAHWKMLLEKYPKTGFRTAVETALVHAERAEAEKKKLKKPTREELEAQEAVRRKRWEAEARTLDLAWRNAGASLEERTESGYELAQRYLALEKYSEALTIYRWIWEQVPASPWADDAAFAAGQTYLKMGEKEKAQGQFIFVLNRFPRSDLCPLVLYCLGNRKVMYDADLKGAWTYYELLLTKYPQHPLAEQTRAYWAAVKKIPLSKLREHSQDLATQQRRKQQS